ncbi:MAG: hypothetical protein ACRYF5_17950 [Janthinobacterium lividum]
MTGRRTRDCFVFEEFEARMLFSAETALLAGTLLSAGAAAPEAMYSQPVTGSARIDTTGQTSTQQDTVRHEIVFIDAAV